MMAEPTGLEFAAGISRSYANLRKSKSFCAVMRNGHFLPLRRKANENEVLVSAIVSKKNAIFYVIS